MGSPSPAVPLARFESVRRGRCPGWSAIITRSGLNGNLPLHPIKTDNIHIISEAREKSKPRIAFFLNFFCVFSSPHPPPALSPRLFCSSFLSTHPGVSPSLIRSPFRTFSGVFRSFHPAGSRAALHPVIPSRRTIPYLAPPGHPPGPPPSRGGHFQPFIVYCSRKEGSP